MIAFTGDIRGSWAPEFKSTREGEAVAAESIMSFDSWLESSILEGSQRCLTTQQAESGIQSNHDGIVEYGKRRISLTQFGTFAQPGRKSAFAAQRLFFVVCTIRDQLSASLR